MLSTEEVGKYLALLAQDNGTVENIKNITTVLKEVLARSVVIPTKVTEEMEEKLRTSTEKYPAVDTTTVVESRERPEFSMVPDDYDIEEKTERDMI